MKHSRPGSNNAVPADLDRQPAATFEMGMMPLFLFACLFTDPAEEQLAAELARFPPCLNVQTFPSWGTAWCAQEEWLTRRIELGDAHAYDYGLWRSQVTLFKDCWEQLRRARDNPYGESVATRMGYLRLLRFYLGDDAYLTGRMPPPVPWWRFTCR